MNEILKFMRRFVIVFFLCWLAMEVSAQGGAIPKSEDVVVIRGKSYYLHTVEAGQTLYSICKAYGVAVDEVKQLNDKTDNALSLYEVLKIPFVEPAREVPFVQRDDKYYYHRVQKGETLYSIARHYGMKPRRLLKHNPDYKGSTPLSVGAVVRVPLSEIDQQALVQVAPVEVKVEGADDGGTGEPASGGEDVAAGGGGVPVDTLSVVGEGALPLPGGEGMRQDSSVRVALLLPLFAGEYPAYQDSLPEFQSVKIAPKAAQFVAFYEGMLLAADSLKNKGYRVDLHVFDTERSTQRVHLLAEEVNRLHPDVVIGPVYESTYKVLLEKLADKRIPVVYPLSSRGGNIAAYPNAIQVNPSFKTLVDAMTRWLSLRAAEANVINIRTGNEGADDAERRILQEGLAQVPGMRIFMWGMEAAPLDSLRSMLLPDRENILVMPTDKEADVSNILPLVSALSGDYPISVVGLPDWQKFTSVDHETYYKLNTRVFSYNHVDYASEAGKRLVDNYHKYFYGEPVGLVFRAYDMGMYFMELAARYPSRTLEMIGTDGGEQDFSLFRFATLPQGGKENSGFYIIQYSSDYQVRIERLP